MARSEVEVALDSLANRTTFGLCFIIAFAVSVIGILVWYGHASSHQADKIEALATETHRALCTFRADLSARYQANVKLLNDHPEDPVHVYGLVIPRSQLVSNTSAQKSTLDALKTSGLDCE